jgi:capsular exopolysaccharide synthesis family protein
VLNTLLAAVLGLLIALGIAWVAEYLNDSVRDSDDVQDVSGLSTLGTIVQMKGEGGRSEIYQLATLLYPRSSVAEAYRTLRSNIEFSSVDAPIQTLLVTSAMPGEGKTVTATNLAVVFAQAGRRVLLVDADLRKPGVHVLFKLPNFQGLTTLLRRDEASIETVVQRTEQDNLQVLTTGPLPPNPAELLGSQRMRAILEQLKAGYDLLVLDSPPVQAVADAAILSSFMDGSLFVIDAAKSRRRAVHQARETLDRAGAHVVGAVLNRIPSKARAGHADYYGDVYGGDAGPDRRAGGAEGLPGRSTT